MKIYNPNKDLVQIGKSGRVLWNRNPKYVEGKYMSGHPLFADYFYIDDQPLMKLAGMIFWLGIGDKDFDVREMRKAGGFRKEEYAADKKFHHPLAQLQLVARQLETVAQQQDFDEFLKRILSPRADFI